MLIVKRPFLDEVIWDNGRLWDEVVGKRPSCPLSWSGQNTFAAIIIAAAINLRRRTNWLLGTETATTATTRFALLTPSYLFWQQHLFQGEIIPDKQNTAVFSQNPLKLYLRFPLIQPMESLSTVIKSAH